MKVTINVELDTDDEKDVDKIERALAAVSKLQQIVNDYEEEDNGDD